MGRPVALVHNDRPGAGRQRFRFPCGHVESRGAVDRRTRLTERAGWVRCRACNVTCLVVIRVDER